MHSMKLALFQEIHETQKIKICRYKYVCICEKKKEKKSENSNGKDSSQNKDEGTWQITSNQRLRKEEI